MPDAQDSGRWRRRLFASARLRILASYLILLLFSTVVGALALREVLLTRAGERVDDALVQEVEEFRRLARDGRDPRTGEPFRNLPAIFNVFLARNVPASARPSSATSAASPTGRRPTRASATCAFRRSTRSPLREARAAARWNSRTAGAPASSPYRSTRPATT